MFIQIRMLFCMHRSGPHPKIGSKGNKFWVFTSPSISLEINRNKLVFKLKGIHTALKAPLD